MPQRPRRERFPGSARLHYRREFEHVFRQNCRASDPWLTLYVARNDGGLRRLGVIAGTRLGPAVRRNRVKRLVREAFRRLRPDLPAGLDWVVLPRPGPDPTLPDLRQSLRELTNRLRARLGYPVSAGPAHDIAGPSESPQRP